ncbi:hypothetical protein CDG60_12215 [Acinetobacter chinensis]|uniref:Uncharacterized protein n=1 Tax=Acinetobacter chinensis TaxID=2004650 RepID=A0A3B7LWV6_9GAMM|nr:hypothetical protein [Acinetobacter chinensis]AXY57262.1 hypothetical protein CDG60_12215 [Acinetobacter chinensis]
MNRLDLCPLQESYSVQFGCSVRRDELPGGFSRYSTVTPSKRHSVGISFVLTEPDFKYFRAFYLNWQRNPLPFLMKLIIESSEYKDYVCQFVADSFSFNELNGKLFKVSAQLVVVISHVSVLTSKMYQYYEVESIQSAFTVDNSMLNEAVNTEIDAIKTNFTVTDAKYVSEIEYRTENFGSESIESAFKVTDAKYMSEIEYRTESFGIESVESAFKVTDAKYVLEVSYIEAEKLVEAVQSNFTVTDAKYIEEI